MRQLTLRLVLAGAVATTAVFAADSKDAHLQAAAAAAGQDLKGILSVCDPRTGQPPPKRDAAVKDGEKLPLGDPTIDFYVTPPHAPATISIIMPLKDGTARHVGGEWGGTAFNFAPTAQNFATYAASAERFAKIARD